MKRVLVALVFVSVLMASAGSIEVVGDLEAKAAGIYVAHRECRIGIKSREIEEDVEETVEDETVDPSEEEVGETEPEVSPVIDTEEPVEEPVATATDLEEIVEIVEDLPDVAVDEPAEENKEEPETVDTGMEDFSYKVGSSSYVRLFDCRSRFIWSNGSSPISGRWEKSANHRA